VTWIKAGKKDIRDVARQKVKTILKEHFPEPLSKDIQEKLRQIVKNAEKQIIRSSPTPTAKH
jgi:trimethylamine:corrinoid methyltransferase-like protein